MSSLVWVFKYIFLILPISDAAAMGLNRQAPRTNVNFIFGLILKISFSDLLPSSVTGHGDFLVRQSETRKGEFVLTFNFQVRKNVIFYAYS